MIAHSNVIRGGVINHIPLLVILQHLYSCTPCTKRATALTFDFFIETVRKYWSTIHQVL